MKEYKFNIAILTNTNRIVSSSQSDWSDLRKGSFVKVGSDNAVYNIAEVRKFFHIKPFEKVDKFKIKIDDANPANLFSDDIVKLTFKRYSIVDYSVVNPGEGYHTGQTFSPSITSKSKGAVFEVLETSKTGSVQKLRLTNAGDYYSNDSTVDIESAQGSGLKLKLFYQENDNRLINDYVIERTSFEHGANYIEFGQPLPDIPSGKLSVEKWEAFLSTNYMGKDRIGVPFRVTRDFTPNLGLPLMPDISLAQGFIYNEAIKMLDKRISELERKLSG